MRSVSLMLISCVAALGGCLLDRAGTFTAGPGDGGGDAASGGAATTTSGGAGGAPTAAGGAPQSGGGEPGGGGTGGAPGPICGDGLLEGDEACDDGNLDPADGCSATCTVEDRDSCEAAPVLAVGSATITVTGDTTGASDDVDETTAVGNCAPNTWPGADHFFVVVPQGDGTLHATLDAQYDNHHLHVRSACPGDTDLACQYRLTSSLDAEVVLAVTMGTPYYVFVDSWDSKAGAYTLTVVVED